jgi:hypothetical protein
MRVWVHMPSLECNPLARCDSTVYINICMPMYVVCADCFGEGVRALSAFRFICRFSWNSEQMLQAVTTFSWLLINYYWNSNMAAVFTCAVQGTLLSRNMSSYFKSSREDEQYNLPWSQNRLHMVHGVTTDETRATELWQHLVRRKCYYERLD